MLNSFIPSYFEETKNRIIFADYIIDFILLDAKNACSDTMKQTIKVIKWRM